MIHQLDSSSSLQLNSVAFILLALCFLFLVKVGRYFKLQGPFMAVINLFFLYYFIASKNGFIFFAGLLFFTYLIAETRRRIEDRNPNPIFLILTMGLWVCLFLVKVPNFSIFNPFYYFPVNIIGISFMLFRCINYIEDAHIQVDRSFLSFLNYMIYFPTFIMGPIERYDNFIKYYHDPQKLNAEKVLLNLHRIATGAIKKFIIADNLAIFTTFGNLNFNDLSYPMLWIYVLLQLPVLYLDFSGYCDIVIGLSGLVGIPLTENFNKPFKASNIQEFWTRWHISLTSFIRDYVFNPLHKFALKQFPHTSRFFIMNLIYFFTMMLIALWHDVSWRFFIFGMLHGIALIFIQIKKQYFVKLKKIDSFFAAINIEYVSWLVNFIFISLTMIVWMLDPKESAYIILRLLGVR